MSEISKSADRPRPKIRWMNVAAIFLAAVSLVLTWWHPVPAFTYVAVAIIFAWMEAKS